MISVEAALTCLLDTAKAKSLENIIREDVKTENALHRVLAVDAVAALTQPPFNASAMDGYAVNFNDMDLGQPLKIIGEAPAGFVFKGHVERGQALRVFTGSVMPKGTDHVVIQEDVLRTGDIIDITETQFAPSHIRKAGVDFKAGDILFPKGTRLKPLHLSAIAAANIQTLSVFTRPKVIVFANGDELKTLGDDIAQGQIISSTPYALCNLLREWGADVEFLGIIPDDRNALSEAIKRAEKTADVIVPLGGASVGDYDLVKGQFKAAGFKAKFEKIAVKPGKPTWFSQKGNVVVLGLPGNPASALVCAFLFLRPFIQSLCGQRVEHDFMNATLTQSLSSNGPRETYLRGIASVSLKGTLHATPFSRQDSSLLMPFTKANVLIRRKPNDSKKEISDLVDCVVIGPLS